MRIQISLVIRLILLLALALLWQSAGVAYTWDADGKVRPGRTSAYSDDAANRLVQVDPGDVVDRYAYHGPGDRLQQTVHGVAPSYTPDPNAGTQQLGLPSGGRPRHRAAAIER